MEEIEKYTKEEATNFLARQGLVDVSDDVFESWFIEYGDDEYISVDDFNE